VRRHIGSQALWVGICVAATAFAACEKTPSPPETAVEVAEPKSPDQPILQDEIQALDHLRKASPNLTVWATENVHAFVQQADAQPPSPATYCGLFYPEGARTPMRFISTAAGPALIERAAGALEAPWTTACQGEERPVLIFEAGHPDLDG
jgi:hypothetical protein